MQDESGVPAMCARGLLILMCCDGLEGSSDTRWVAAQVLSSFLEIVKGSNTERRRISLAAWRVAVCGGTQHQLAATILQRP